MTNDQTGKRQRMEDGVVIGNQIDKGRVGNPVARWAVRGFDAALDKLVAAIRPWPESVHEVGCGEGRLSRRLWDSLEVPIRATDFSRQLIAENSARHEQGIQYAVRSIYDLDPVEDRADLIVCCEVLEHLERPAEALEALRRLAARQYILSVPREPFWRTLNLARGNYVASLGNTPGHIHHWSARGFVRFLERGGFRVERRLQPWPWTMVSGRFL